MNRKTLISSMVLAALGGALPPATFAQATEHQHADGAHDHANPVVSCSNLASPPWTGLPEGDQQLIASLQESLANLSSTEAALAAGFEPMAGDIPGMGVHYVSWDRSRNGVRANEPDHLLFSRVDGEERLVGAAYAFVDAVDAEVPNPFETELAHWHDHPEIAPRGQTLHMLHVWFVPSSNGPFAGLNFLLPFEARGISPPSSCWMADTEVAQRIQNVAFALTPPGTMLERMITRGRAESTLPAEPSLERLSILADLDTAATEEDRTAWVDAADRLLGDLSEAEWRRTQMLLRLLTNAQMSSADRDARDN